MAKKILGCKPTTPKEWSRWREAVSKMAITPEERARWETILVRTWHAIGDDIEQCMEGRRLTTSIIVEVVCDADRPCDYGMTREEYRAFCALSHSSSATKWLRGIFKGYA